MKQNREKNQRPIAINITIPKEKTRKERIEEKEKAFKNKQDKSIGRGIKTTERVIGSFTSFTPHKVKKTRNLGFGL